MQQRRHGRSRRLIEGLDETATQNLRRYGSLVLDYVAARRSEKQRSPAVVSHVRVSAAQLATDLDIPKQVAGRVLTTMETCFPSVTKGSQSYHFDIDAIPMVETVMDGMDALHTRKAEAAMVSAIVDLYGPIHGSDIQSVLNDALGYPLNTHQVQARIAHLEDVETLPGTGSGYVRVEKFEPDQTRKPQDS